MSKPPQPTPSYHIHYFFHIQSHHHIQRTNSISQSNPTHPSDHCVLGPLQLAFIISLHSQFHYHTIAHSAHMPYRTFLSISKKHPFLLRWVLAYETSPRHT